MDRNYKGPYRVVSVTPTNVFIHPLSDPKDQITASLQRVSKCDDSLSSARPWMGHRKSRKRRRINKTHFVSHVQEDDSSSHIQTAGQRVSQSGRKINRPARYLQLTAPMGQSSEEGEDVKTPEQVGARKRREIDPVSV